MALSVGHLTDEVTGLSTVDPIYVGSVWDLIRCSPVRKRMSERRNSSAIIEARSAQSSSSTSARNSFRDLLTSGTEDVPSCPDVKRHRAGLCFVGRGLNTSKPPLTPVAAELDKLKELYKKVNKDFKT